MKIQAHRERIKIRMKEDRILAWNIAAVSRLKRLPDPAKLLEDQPEKPQPCGIDEDHIKSRLMAYQQRQGSE